MIGVEKSRLKKSFEAPLCFFGTLWFRVGFVFFLAGRELAGVVLDLAGFFFGNLCEGIVSPVSLPG